VKNATDILVRILAIGKKIIVRNQSAVPMAHAQRILHHMKKKRLEVLQVIQACSLHLVKEIAND
jgi:hypothetical protein